jgi:putative membrane protein
MSWTVHPSVLFGLVALYAGYLLLIGPLRRRFHTPDQIWKEPVETREILFFSLGVLALLIAEVSPLHDLSEDYLFSAHMAQHLLMTMAAAPLLLLGTPAWVFRPILQHPVSARLARLLTRPIVAIILFNATLALWHMPELYNLALANHAVHSLEHFSFVFTAALLWWPIFSPLPELPKLSYPLQMLYLFVQSLVPAVIAAFITFSDRVIYSWYAAAPRLWGISPLADQQIGGLMMKIIGGIALWVPATIIFFIWYQHDEAEVEKSWE